MVYRETHRKQAVEHTEGWDFIRTYHKLKLVDGTKKGEPVDWAFAGTWGRVLN